MKQHTIHRALALLLVSGTLLLAPGCDDGDYDDWVDPVRTDAAGKVTVDVSAQSAGTVFTFTDETQDDQLVPLFTPQGSAQGAEKVTTRYTVTFEGSEEELDAVDGSITAKQLREAVEKKYGKAPEERTLEATVKAYVTADGATVTSATTVQIKAKLTAPVIEEAYFLIGEPTGWKCQKAYEFKRAQASVDGGVSLYDDPVFTLTFDAPTEDDPDNAGQQRNRDWGFKIVPKSQMAADDGGDPLSWDGLLCSEVDNCTDFEQVIGPKPFSGALKVLADQKTLKYKLTLNMMDYKVVITPLAYEEWIYLPGSGPDGWDCKKASGIRSVGSTGIYEGFANVGSEFKFTRARDWDHGEYNAGMVTTKPEGFGGDNNITAGTPGLYKLKFDATDPANCALEATLVESVGLVGDAAENGWDEKQPMALTRQDDGTWKGEHFALKSGTWKLVANNGWGINWGGDMASLSHDGANLWLETAGTYTVVFHPTVTEDVAADGAHLASWVELTAE